MKKNILVVLFIILIPVQSYAWIDGSIYGGYTFHGDVEIVDAHYKDVKGYDYGAMFHLNLNPDMFLL